MPTGNPYSNYHKNAVITANQPQLAEMLFSGAMRFLRQAISSVENQKPQEAHNAIVRVQQIFAYLAETLDEKNPVSFNLAQLYDYAYRRLVEANVSKDPDILREVLQLTTELRDTWHEARQSLAEEGAHAEKADTMV